MITADQLVAHAIGDYILQSDWMATTKTKRSFAALVHAVTYALPFLFLSASVPALLAIAGTHFVIDRWRLARWLVLAKNVLSDPRTWKEQLTPLDVAEIYDLNTGSPKERPPFLSVWLLIVADNVVHVLINASALRWL